MNGVDVDDLHITESTSMPKNLPLYFPAKEPQDVFIPLDSTVAELKKILKLDKNAPTYIRAPVATGKTTLAIYLATKYKDEFTMVQTASEEDQTRKNIVKAIRQSGVLPAQQHSSIDFDDALKALASANKTLVFDEAHLVFKYPNLVYDLIKAPSGWVETRNLKLLFFSAAGADQGGSEYIGTPPQISKKYFWYPPMPDPIVLAERLEEAEVSLDPDSVLFFLKLCSGHRGIFMTAMGWVRMKQSNLKSSRCWDIHDTVSYVKASIARSKSLSEVGWTTGIRQYMTKSRAVYVNGGFSDEIPDPFEQVLFGGAKTSAFLGQKHLRNLTIAGFLVPVRGSGSSSSEFVEYNWDDVSVLYGVANSIMAEYYGDRFAADPYNYKPKLIKNVPNTAADLLARALPFMSFATVVDNPLPMDQEAEGLKTSLSRNKLPHEDNYNQALAAMLTNLNYRVSTPFDKKNGKTDVVVTYEKNKTCAFECIMASRPPVSCLVVSQSKLTAFCPTL